MQGLTTAKSAVANPFAGFSGLSGTSSKPATVKTGGACSSGQAAASSGSHQQAMENLNKAFLRFVNGQLQTHPSVSWVDAVQVGCSRLLDLLKEKWRLTCGLYHDVRRIT